MTFNNHGKYDPCQKHSETKTGRTIEVMKVQWPRGILVHFNNISD